MVVTLPAVKPDAVPVIFVPINAEGVPKAGVTSVGLVANTLAPLPVSSVKAAAKLAEEGVAKNVATFAPKPLTPVLIGSPVALVKVAEVGVPKTGVIKVGLVESTTEPVPVETVTPVPPFTTGSVPVTLVAKLTNVVDVVPVPPEVTGSAVPRAKVAK